MSLSIYRPEIETGAIYFPEPGTAPVLKYNHDVDIIRFQGKYLAAWNANEAGAEDVPGQFNFLATSPDFAAWTRPVKLFSNEAGCENPVESDNQWQPAFINVDDKVLYCAWCDFVARRVFVAVSTDGHRWKNVEVENAPPSLKGQACAFPTNHGLITKKGRLLFPCSIPSTKTPRCIVGDTYHAGLLMSDDGGKTWSWSDPVEAVTWDQMGVDPKLPGGNRVAIWEPALFEHPDGTIGLLIRNSSSQDNVDRKPHDLPHHMLLYAESRDGGKSWTRARPVEVDTIISRNYAAAGFSSPSSLLMVMNDWYVGIPKNISFDRYFLSLYLAPVCDPDLLLPGPSVQPAGGTAFYPNGFIDGKKLRLAYTYGGIHGATVKALPDFKKPFLLPRASRSGLRIEGSFAHLEQRASTLGLVLTEKLTRADALELSFKVMLKVYRGEETPILTLGGKTHSGTALRVAHDAGRKAHFFQVKTPGGWTELAQAKVGQWHTVTVRLGKEEHAIAIDGKSKAIEGKILRKIAFGGLYEAPEWPMGMWPAKDTVIDLDSIKVS